MPAELDELEGLLQAPAKATPAASTAPELDELDSVLSPSSGTKTPSPHERKMEELMADDTFDPPSFAAGKAEDHPDYILAQEVAWQRDQRPLTLNRAVSATGSAIGAIPGVVKDMGVGIGEGLGNAAVSLDPGMPEEVRQRAQTTAAISAQNLETNVGGLAARIAGPGTVIGRLGDWLSTRDAFGREITKPEQTAPELMPHVEAAKGRLADDPRTSFNRKFAHRAQEAAGRAQLAEGRVLEGGAVAGAMDAAGVPIKEFAMSPEEMAAQGMPWTEEDAAQTQRIATGADPTNLLPMHIPVVSAAANKVAGRVVQGAGKAVQAGGRALDKTASKLGSGLTLGSAISGGLDGGLLAGAGYAGAKLGAKGAKVIGQVLEEQGKMAATGKGGALAANVGKDVVTDSRSLKGELSAAAQKGGNAVVGAVAAPMAAAPFNLLITDSPEEFAHLEAGTVGVGGVAGAMPRVGRKRLNPEVAAASRAYLVKEGSAPTGDAYLDKLHDNFMKKAPEDVRDSVNAMRGYFNGMEGVTEGGSPVKSNTYVLSKADFIREYRRAFPEDQSSDADLANQAGFYNPETGVSLVNGESRLASSAQGAETVVGHETGGHAGEAVLRFMQQEGSPFNEALKRSMSDGLFQNGAPTPEFSAFIQAYKQNAPEAIKALPETDPYWQSEFLAETAAQVLHGKGGVTNLAIPETIADKIANNVGRFWSNFTGVNPDVMGDGGAALNRTQVAEVNRAMVDFMKELGRQKFRPGEQSAEPSVKPKTEEAASAVPPEPSAAPTPESTAAPAEAAVPAADPLASMGLTPELVADAKARHVEQGMQLYSGAKAGKTAGSRAQRRAELEAEFDEMFSAYQQKLTETGQESPTNTHELSQAIIRNYLGEVPASAPKPASTAVAELPPQPQGRGKLGSVPEPEVAPRPSQPQDKPLEGSIADRLTQAEAQAKADPSFARKRTESGRNKAVNAAKMEVVEEALANQPEGALRVTREKVGLPGNEVEVSRVRGKVDPENEVHRALLDMAGVAKGSRAEDALIRAQDAAESGETLFLDYGSAPKEGTDLSGEQRAKELAQSPAAKRIQGGEKVENNKAFIPLDVSYAAGEENPSMLVRGFDVDTALLNADKLADAAKQAGVPVPYQGKLGFDYDGLIADVQKYAQNHRNGWKGDGSDPIVEVGPVRDQKTNLNFEPQKIAADKFQFLNAVFNIDPTGARRSPESQAKQAVTGRLAELNNTLTMQGETNSFRELLKAAGFDVKGQLETPYRSLRPELMNVHGNAESSSKTIRPHGFSGDRGAVGEKGLPKGRYVGAGFRPDKEGAKETRQTWYKDKNTGRRIYRRRGEGGKFAAREASSSQTKMRPADGEKDPLIGQFLPDSDDKIKAAAIRTKDGKIFEGMMHFFAYENAYGDEAPNRIGTDEEGFVTEQGKFLSREEAYQLANKTFQKPIEQGAAREEKLYSEDVMAEREEGMFGAFRPDTQEFKDWFGDSKVTTRSGRPLVVYHATGSDFTTFDTTKGDLGAHFGNQDQANYIAEKRIGQGRNSKPGVGPSLMPVYLKLENPLRLRDVGSFHADAIADQLARKGIIDAKRAKEIAKEGDENWRSRKALNEEVRAAIEEAGYDGVVYKNSQEGDGDSYIAFRPEQIKSATGNSGEFNPKNPDIRFRPDEEGKYPLPTKEEVKAYRGRLRDDGLDPKKIDQMHAEMRKNPAISPVRANYVPPKGGRLGKLDPESTYGKARAQFKPEELDSDLPQTSGFRKWIKGAKIVRSGDYIGVERIKSGEPVVLEGFHGTTHDFNTFDPSAANVENDFGRGIYLSTTPEDVAANYAGEGPDLTSRIDREVDYVNNMVDGGAVLEDITDRYPVDDDVAQRALDGDDKAIREVAASKLKGGNASTMKVFAKLESPLKLGGREEIWDYQMDPDDDYAEPTGKLVDFLEAIERASNRFDDGGSDDAMTELREKTMDGVTPSEAIKAAREAFSYYSDPDSGDLASSEIIRQAIEEMGYDGIIDSTVNEKFGSNRKHGKPMEGMDHSTAHVIAFKPESIKSATGNSGKFDPKNPDIRFRPDELGFESQLEKVAQEKFKGPASGKQILDTLKNSGVKPEEMDWAGLPEFLEGKERVTPQELQSFIDQNRVKVKEVTKTTKARNELDKARYGQWKLPGGKNYKEHLLLQAPKLRPYHIVRDQVLYPAMERVGAVNENAVRRYFIYKDEGRLDEWASDRDADAAAKAIKALEEGGEQDAMNSYEESLKEGLKLSTNAFGSKHWLERGVLAHTREQDFVDVDGAKVRLMEEDQSDWHQAGRKRGYGTDAQKKLRAELLKLTSEMGDEYKELKSEVSRLANGHGSKDKVMELAAEDGEYYDALDQILTYNEDPQANGVPDAPFKKTWHELAFKRALRRAVDDGMDKFAWITGEIAADRFDISRRVDRLVYFPDGTLRGYKGKAEVINEKNVSDEKLVELVGKDVADLLLEAPLVDEAPSENSEAEPHRSLSGEGLKVGGKGMKGFYDKILPDFARKYVRKWGATVDTTVLPKLRKGPREQEARENGLTVDGRYLIEGPDDIVMRANTRAEAERLASKVEGAKITDLKDPDGQIVHSITITPQMRESVKQGQPLFRPDEYVDKVAVKGDSGEVKTGQLHGIIRSGMSEEGVDGYLTNTGRFVTREEADKLPRKEIKIGRRGDLDSSEIQDPFRRLPALREDLAASDGDNAEYVQRQISDTESEIRGMGYRKDGEFYAPMFRPDEPARKQPKLEAKDAEKRINTRQPWATGKNALNEEGPLTVGLEPMLKHPDLVEKIGDTLGSYKYLRLPSRKPEKRIREFADRIKDNLLFLHDTFPEDLRATSKLWYDGARKITEQWADDYDLPREAVAGAMAALSPQKDWFQNVSLAKRVIEVVKNHQETKFDQKMADAVMARSETIPGVVKLLENLKGKKLKDLDAAERAIFVRMYDEAHNPRSYPIISPDGRFMENAKAGTGNDRAAAWGSFGEIAKALSVLEDPSVENISTSMGEAHKVRNFYNNILQPNGPHGDVTIDTHAVAAGLLLPLAGSDLEVSHNLSGPPSHAKTGSVGLYGIYADAYRQAARERGILPREMQSITWEAIRGLFAAKWKTAKNKDRVREIWMDVARGNLTPEDGRQKILEIAGGIDTPDWAKGGSGGDRAKKAGPARDPGKLPESGLPRKPSRGAERRGGARLAGVAPDQRQTGYS